MKLKLSKKNLVVLNITLLLICIFQFIYYKRTEFYKDNECIDVKKENAFKLILLYWDIFSNEHDIKYSIFFGTLLGYMREKEFIGYDGDMDAIIDKDGCGKLKKLAKDKNEKRVVFTKDLKDSLSGYWRHNEIKILVKYEDYYVNCKGERVYKYTDSCSLGMPKWGGQDLCARVILNDITNTQRHLDLYYNYKKYNHNYKKLFKKISNASLEGCNIKLPSNKDEIVKTLVKGYGKNWNVPIKKCNKKTGTWVDNTTKGIQ